MAFGVRSRTEEPTPTATEAPTEEPTPTGWVSQNWSMAQELSPIINKVGGRVVEPIITNMISNYPDAELPRIAHDVVDAAIENGGMNLFEGNLSFDAEDLRQLKKLLDYNLPVSEASGYEVKTQP